MRFPRAILDKLREEAPAVPTAPADYCPPTIHPKQRAFLELGCDEGLYGGAAGGGKSEALLRAALQYVHIPHYAAMLFRRTHTDLALPGALMDRAHEWLDGTDAKWHDRERQWEFPSGATLTFGYMDGPRDHMRYKSMEIQFCGFDELTEFLEAQYLYLFSRIRRTHGMGEDVPLRMRAATNPGDIGHDWVGRRWAIPAIPDQSCIYHHEGRAFVPARAEDNPSLDLPAYERMLDKLDPVTRKQLREGHWIRDTSGLVYYCWNDARNTEPILPAIKAGEKWSHILACDFGVTDPTAFVELAFTKHDPRVFVTRSEQWPGLSPSEAAEKCRAWGRTIGGYDRIVGDVGGLGKGFEAEWRTRFRIPLHSAQKTDKLGYIKLLNGDLHRGLVVVLPGNDQLVSDVRALAWKDEKHRDEHPGMPNHLPDALLYGWRDCRHWQWEDRTPELTEAEKQQKIEDERFEKRLQRNQQREDDEWILGPD